MCKRPTISIIIVSFNGLNYLRPLTLQLLKVKEVLADSLEIIIVDNNSKNGTLDWLIKQESVRKIYNNENVGLARACNQGAALANGDLLFFLNQDTSLVDPLDFVSVISEILKLFESDKRVAVCFPKILFMDRPGVINSAGGQMDIYGFACDRGFLQPSNCFARIEEVFEGSLACMIVRKCIFDKIGGFDEQMFIVDEDTDFCWRCWLAGYKVIFFPKALVYHKGSFSIGVFNPNRRFLSVRNTLRMIIKNAGIRLLIVMTGRFLVIKSLQIFYFIVKREHDMAMAILKALYWNLVNLRDTLIERRRVQKLRKTHDKYIHTKLTPYSLEIQIFKQRIYERINNTGWSNGRRVR